MLMADTRPSSRGGVTDWRSVVVEITHRIGPAPSRKKLKPASRGEGKRVVAAMITDATRPVTGPRPITVPKARLRITRVASRAHAVHRERRTDEAGGQAKMPHGI